MSRQETSRIPSTTFKDISQTAPYFHFGKFSLNFKNCCKLTNLLVLHHLPFHLLLRPFLLLSPPCANRENNVRLIQMPLVFAYSSHSLILNILLHFRSESLSWYFKRSLKYYSSDTVTNTCFSTLLLFAIVA